MAAELVVESILAGAESAVRVVVVVIEQIGADDVADLDGQIQSPRGVNSFAQQFKVRKQRKINRAAENLMNNRRIGRGTLSDNHVANPNILVHAAARPDADKFLCAVDVNQLVQVNRNRRNAHARPLHRNALALVLARKAENISDSRVLVNVLQKVFGDDFGANGVAGQQDALGNLADLSRYVNACHDVSSRDKKIEPVPRRTLGVC